MALAPADGGTAEEDAHAFDVGSDSDDSGWLIEESRITFTEAGYTLCVVLGVPSLTAPARD
jgi:hypothetical protein